VATTDRRVKVAVDSCVIIARITGDLPDMQPGIDSLFHEVDLRLVRLYGSTLLVPEVLGGGFADPPDLARENAIRGILDNPNVLTPVQVTRQVAWIARELRRELHLKTPDAAHLASAVYAGADWFMTTDADDFPIGSVVRGVRISLPDSVSGATVLPGG
jgi:predicted nucleic acid-binding protein